MKIKLLCLVVFISTLSCETKNPDLTITGEISGLKKGKLYLQKVKDSAIINIDSLELYNTNQFQFDVQLNHPEVMYLQLEKDTLERADNFIAFFADKGHLNVNAELDAFMYAKIKADYKNQQQFQEYSQNIKRFGDQKLELIKAELEARKANNQNRLDSINQAYNKMSTRRYLYAINFAMNHPDLEVSPYVILNQAQYINTKYLDSVYQSFDKSIQKSYYGQELNNLVTQRHSN
ncbi:DUF4369 domain-containing protein [Mesohalobacter halotolerans]|uniref:DUF4369 domain-containing protein n=1 Tax=Mesohalobacter halotolerans TaxID=1883405 RepID=A0A4U5TRD9_9FLAO|nr:DUF4369 domain-containing protein [Mesohalobacter halotolerans]MBS3739454.1 DUF4369 domain-containing protein [Psychroflexus sp.]TKS56656.1 DUF4369 domain-containing protein [Mesohalobacter halotolerans]